jgi:hypothetical protein
MRCPLWIRFSWAPNWATAAKVPGYPYNVEAPDEIDEPVASPPTPLPETSVGSKDASVQKEAILADSAERSEDLEAAPGSFVEHRTSDEATEPST